MSNKKDKQDKVQEQDKQDQEYPVIKSISLHKVPDMGNNGWVCLTIYSQNDKIIKVESSEPNLREITIEQAKINFVKLFLDGDE